MYPSSFLLPAAIASARFDGVDLAERFPSLRRIAASWFAGAVPRWSLNDAGERRLWFGAKPSWNDDGLGWVHSNAPLLAMALAPPEQQGALRTQFDKLNGVDAPEPFCGEYLPRFFTLLHYPYETEPADPDAVLPRHVTDSRQGYTFFHNRYADADDAVLGAYARCTFIGGHHQDDAGSLRFSALDCDWIVGGGQARPDAEWQSVLTPAGGREGEYGRGAIVVDEATDAGGVFGIDLRPASGGYHERFAAVNYSARSEAPVVLALLDQVDDHLGRDWQWHLSLGPTLEPQIDEDGQGFRVAGPGDASMVVRFLGPCQPERIQPRRMPDSQRTFENGQTVHYPGRAFVTATFANREHLGIYALITIQRDESPQVELIGEGLAVQVGQWRWDRPFGAAVPEAYRPGASGSLCKYPGGDG